MTRQVPERCPKCGKKGFRVFIDPRVGLFCRCSYCKYEEVQEVDG